jgi:hypothetical protein
MLREPSRLLAAARIMIYKAQPGQAAARARLAMLGQETESADAEPA